MIEQLVLGDPYTRADIDKALGTSIVATSREGPVYVPSLGIALVFVTSKRPAESPN